MTHLHLLLLDLDDVLLFSGGYRAALRGAVGYFGRRLGYPDVPLSDADIDVFEAFGLTAEWDSATVCVSLLLTQLWEHFPEFQAAKTGDCRPPAHHHLPLPDFQAFIAGLPAQVAGQSSALAAAEEGLLRRSSFLSAGQRELLQDLLGSTRLFERSPIHRLIQEFNLGSQGFTEIYGMQPSLAIESTLLMYDRPRLDDADRRLLGNWANDPDHRAVIFTNRPSTPPRGAFDTPEAELGVKASGLPDLRIIGGGGLAWISRRRGLNSGDFLKPSPVHALAGLRLALGDTLELALEAAAGLALDGTMDPDWTRLDESDLHVFEDSAKGLRSAQAAAHVLKEHGISLRTSLYGVSDSEPKRAALSAAGASLFDDIQTALACVEGLEGINR